MPLVADFFADQDTRDIAPACLKLDDLKRGFQWKTLGPALEALAEEAPSPLLGVLYGAGFEDRTNLLAKIAERWPLLGNEPSVVERIKDPELFFAELSRLGVQHPRTVTDPSAAGDCWLAKRQGGAGGSHVVASQMMAKRKEAGRVYFQERSRGAQSLPYSLLPGIAPPCSASASNGRRRPHTRNGAMGARHSLPSFPRS